jgi:hypothetical protein
MPILKDNNLAEEKASRVGPESQKLKALGTKIASLHAEEVQLNITLGAEQAALDKFIRETDATGLSKFTAEVKKIKGSTVAMISNLKKEENNDLSEQLASVEKSKTKKDRMKEIEYCIQSIQRKKIEINTAEGELKTLLKTHEENEQQAKKNLIAELNGQLEGLKNSVDPNELKSIKDTLDKCLNDNNDQAFPYEQARNEINEVIKTTKEPLRGSMESIIEQWIPTKDNPDVTLANIDAYKTRKNRKIADQIEHCISQLEQHIKKNEKRFVDIPNSISIVLKSMQFEKNKFLTENERRAETRRAEKATQTQWDTAAESITHKGTRGEFKGVFESIPIARVRKALTISSKPEDILAEFQKVVDKHDSAKNEKSEEYKFPRF